MARRDQCGLKHPSIHDPRSYLVRLLWRRIGSSQGLCLHGQHDIKWQTYDIHLPLGITKSYKEKNQCIKKKTGAQNIVKETKQYQKKWLQHVHRMDTNRIPKTSTTIYTEGTKEHRTTEEEMEGPTSPWGLTLQEHDDDDEIHPSPELDLTHMHAIFIFLRWVATTSLRYWSR
jgi:hypothetical protein